MKKVIFLTITLLIIISCDGVLWNGNRDDSLTLTISNPLYQSESSSSSRAMDIQGKYMFIDFVQIDNQAAFDADTSRPLTGDGVWVKTAWGGYAVLNLNVQNLGTILARLQRIPRVKDLKARIILDTDAASVSNGLALDYSEVGPLTATYNPAGSDVYEKMWITIAATDLQSNNVNISLRPSSFYFLTAINLSAQTPINYIDTTATISVTEPNPGESKFSIIQMDLNSVGNYLRDLAIFTNFETNINSIVDLNLFDYWGTPSSVKGGNNLRSFFIDYPVLNPLYVNNDYFIGSTVLDTLPLDDLNYSGQYTVNYGVLYDSTMSINVGAGQMTWNLLSGFAHGDLEFKVLFKNGIGAITDDKQWETISQINALNSVVLRDWSLCSDFNSGGTYTLTGNPTTVGSGHGIILARPLGGGKEFIYARGYDANP